MSTRYLSRMRECDMCGKPMYDKDMLQIYHMEDGKEVTDGFVHRSCEDQFKLWLRRPNQ